MELLEWEKKKAERREEGELVWGKLHTTPPRYFRRVKFSDQSTFTRSLAISPISNPRCRSHTYSWVLTRGVSTGQPNFNPRCRTRTSTFNVCNVPRYVAEKSYLTENPVVGLINILPALDFALTTS